jgi:hypothetical protein
MAAEPFVCYVEQRPARHSTSSRRAVVAAGLLAVAVCAAVLLVSTPRETELIAKPATVKARIADMALATQLIRAAPKLSVSGLHKVVDAWKDEQVSNLGSGMQTLALVPRDIETQLQDSGKLCEKKDVIFEKFNALLKKLGYENKVRNETDQAAYDAKMAALRAWLDGESTYRLEVEKQKEAEEGAAFARAEYEKWDATVKQTKERLEKMQTDYPKEKESIANERELIKTILRLLGIMEDVPLDETSKNAGGYVASEKARSAATLKQLKAKVAELKIQAAKGGAIQLRQVNILQQKLASFAESDAVKDLLMGMLKDLETRDDVIDKSLADTEAELKSHEKNLIKYEKEVVDLSNAADKAKQKAETKDLQRNTLNGNKINSEESYDNEHAEFEIVAPPADKSIFIIQVIMDKINKFCAGDTSDAVVGAGVSMPDSAQ